MLLTVQDAILQFTYSIILDVIQHVLQVPINQGQLAKTVMTLAQRVKPQAQHASVA